MQQNKIFPYNNMQTFHVRVTPRDLRKKIPDTFESITAHVISTFPGALCVHELKPVLHLHCIGQCLSIELDAMASYLRARLTSRGFMTKFYDEDSLKQRTVEYYHGYILKESGKSSPILENCNLISTGGLSTNYLQTCLSEYLESKENPNLSFKQFILRNKPSTYPEVHDLCVLWYRHTTSDFKYDNIKKKYCRALMYAFPEKFSEQLKSRYDHEKLIS